MRHHALLLAALLTGCANPMYATVDDSKGPQPVAASSVSNAWSDGAQNWSAGSEQNAPQAGPLASGNGAGAFPSGGATDPRSLGWGQVAPGDRGKPAGGSARTVPPGSSGAGFDPGTPTIDVQRGATGPVVGQDLGTVSVRDAAPHAVDVATSRTQLLEQFQQLEEDRDSLRDQLGYMQKEFQRMQQQVQTYESLHDRGEQTSVAMQARIDQLEAHVRDLQAENEELAGRLLTAQIRRLEAEKALLENLISSEGARSRPSSGFPPVGSGGAGSGAGSQPSTGGASSGANANGGTQP
ncbi:MAG: hypothetical protein R3F34_16140 [Planctomycetota bacterium]